ncbi:MAG: DUF4124 domain-containing protein [Methylophilaceae bacterium]
MKVQKILSLVCIVALAIPMLANAEIYKWKDKNGVVRYSDTPPPSNVKVDTLGNKQRAKRVKKAEPEAANEEAAPSSSEQRARDKFEETVDPEVEAARTRARNTEIEKKNKQEKETQAKLNADNCKAAKANHQSYVQGGRVYKTNENGDREYLGDDELEAGKVKTQAEIDQYCN